MTTGLVLLLCVALFVLGAGATANPTFGGIVWSVVKLAVWAAAIGALFALLGWWLVIGIAGVPR